MAKFIEVTPDAIDNSREGTRGRVSYPILKAFMETGFYIAQVDLTEENRKPAMMHVLLKAYCQTHDLPVKPVLRRNVLYLVRLDIDEEGKAVPDWKEKQVQQAIAAQAGEIHVDPDDIVPLTAEVVGKKVK